MGDSLGLSGSRTLWEGLSGTLWVSLGLPGTLWDFLGISGTLWESLGLLESLWDSLGGSGTLSDSLGLSGMRLLRLEFARYRCVRCFNNDRWLNVVWNICIQYSAALRRSTRRPRSVAALILRSARVLPRPEAGESAGDARGREAPEELRLS